MIEIIITVNAGSVIVWVGVSLGKVLEYLTFNEIMQTLAFTFIMSKIISMNHFEQDKYILNYYLYPGKK